MTRLSAPYGCGGGGAGVAGGAGVFGVRGTLGVPGTAGRALPAAAGGAVFAGGAGGARPSTFPFISEMSPLIVVMCTVGAFAADPTTPISVR